MEKKNICTFADVASKSYNLKNLKSIIIVEYSTL